MSDVAIIDYGSGNLRSAAKAFERTAREADLGCEILVTDNPEIVAAAGRIVLPGVGAFGDCMRGLEGVPGMKDALSRAVVERGRPFLGICVGMQLMATRGLEHGETQGLNWIAGEVVALKPADPALKVPHMGWNELDLVHPEHPVLAGLGAGAHVYFVHSYHFAVAEQSHIAAETDHGGPIVAMVARDNLFGTQFHPEKSQAVGLRVIHNFLHWRP